MITDRLKEETLPEHKAAEKALNVERSLTDKDSYRDLLKAFYGFYVPVERELSALTEKLNSAGIALLPRLKVSLLKNDLLNLGVDQNGIDHLPMAKDIPLAADLTRALGILYVLEGSTLGGQVITNLLRKKNILENPEVCFHNPYGAQTMPMWLELKRALLASDPDSADEVIESARDTFRKLKVWLENY